MKELLRYDVDYGDMVGYFIWRFDLYLWW